MRQMISPGKGKSIKYSTTMHRFLMEYNTWTASQTISDYSDVGLSIVNSIKGWPGRRNSDLGLDLCRRGHCDIYLWKVCCFPNVWWKFVQVCHADLLNTRCTCPLLSRSNIPNVAACFGTHVYFGKGTYVVKFQPH